MTELFCLTLRQAASGLVAREFSAVELLDATLERLAATEPDVHAFATVTAERDSAASPPKRASFVFARAWTWPPMPTGCSKTRRRA